MKHPPLRPRQLAASTAVSALIAAGLGFALPAAASASHPAGPASHPAGPASRTAASPILATGDRRVVAQPSVPTACTTLSATLATSNEQFSSGAEASPPDTSRIQSALDNCSGTGQAVVLAPSGSDNAFLSGPLSLPASVTLLIAPGATLYASRNPASYQVSGQAFPGYPGL